MSKIKKDEVLETIFQKYEGDFNKDIKLFKSAYNDINGEYTKKVLEIHDREKNRDKKLEMVLEYIKFEKYRLENNKITIESNTNAILANFVVLIIVIGITCLPSLFTHYGKGIYVIATSIIILVFTSLAYRSYKSMRKYPLQLSLYNLAVIVLDTIEKDLSSIISLDEVVVDIETNCQLINESLEGINKTEKKRMKKYSKLFAKQFSVRTKDYSADNCDMLIKDIEEKYRYKINGDKNKLFNEKIKAQDNINNCTRVDVSSYFNSFIYAFIAITLAGTGLFNDKRIILIVIFTYIVTFIITQIFTSFKDILNENSIKSYNNICLSILQKIENEMKEKE